MYSKYSAIFLAAGAAVFLCCAPRGGERAEYFAVGSRGALVGWISRAELGPRRDSSGAFAVTEYRLLLRRWADGRGVVADDLSLVAARRPGEPAYYVAGRWGGGEFRYRRGTSWHYKLVDEFGNVTEQRGPRPPAFLTFRGIALPVATSRDGTRAPAVASLDVADGRVSRYRGRGDGRSWTGSNGAGYVRATFDAEGAVSTFVNGDLHVSRVQNRPRPRAFLFRRPSWAYLPFIIRPRPRTLRLSLPIIARFSRPVRPADGATACNFVNGTFTLEPSLQPPLEPAAGDFAPAGRETWPEIQGAGELERLAASYRAAGKTVRFSAGLGFFAGNLLGSYDWLEVDGRPVAAPGRPMPRLRVALATSEEPATVAAFAVAGEPEVDGADARAAAAEIPGLENGAEFFYTIYCAGTPAGDVAAWYEKTAKEPAVVYTYGEIFGRAVGGVGRCEPVCGAPPDTARTPGLAEFIALGAAVAVADEDDAPPYEFCFPAVGGPARAKWQGFKPVVAAGERRLCREYSIEPGSLRAYYTHDGVLTRLEWHGYVARLAAFPRRAPARETLPSEAPPLSPTGAEGESE
jgi:hypothetical protein